MINFLKKYRFQLINISLIGYCLLLVVLTSLPGNPASKSNQLDKLYHIAAYGLLSFILYFVIYYQNKIKLFKKYPAAFTILFATLFGMINEFHQIFIPTRTFNKYDLLANLIGIILTIVIIKIAVVLNKLYKSVL